MNYKCEKCKDTKKVPTKLYGGITSCDKCCDFDMSTRIVCAAIKLRNGFVVTGVRHFCPLMRAQLKRIKLSIRNSEQGFVDQFGNFLTREEAYPIAKRQKQFKGHHGGKIDGWLCSEDLY